MSIVYIFVALLSLYCVQSYAHLERPRAELTEEDTRSSEQKIREMVALQRSEVHKAMHALNPEQQKLVPIMLLHSLHTTCPHTYLGKNTFLKDVESRLRTVTCLDKRTMLPALHTAHMDDITQTRNLIKAQHACTSMAAIFWTAHIFLTYTGKPFDIKEEAASLFLTPTQHTSFSWKAKVSSTLNNIGLGPLSLNKAVCH